MSKNRQFYGIDISKDVFDVVDQLEHHHQFINDAVMIRLYGEAENPEIWQPPSEYIIEANELHSMTALLLRQRTALKNKLLKQSLAIAKSGLYCDENFRSVNLNNV